MVKKTYIIPEALIVSLNTSNIIAASPNGAPTPNVDTSSSADPNTFETKGVSDVNVWSEEW